MSLVELLVAVTLLSVGMVVALSIYHGARSSYKRGENLSEQQQIARIAFDLISREVRLAGLNVYPDGDQTRPDEAIEAALERALVIRADFDGDDPTDSAVPELSLAGGAYAMVSTGNDEIHGFVLARSRPDGSAAGTDRFSFDADVGQARRDGGVETVEVSNVSLALDDPPYTLYRISLDDDASGFGTSGFVNRTVLADNIRSLRFRYFDPAGAEIVPPGGGDDPASVQARAAIARVMVEIETLTRSPRPGTTDFGSFLLAGEIAPRNRGKIHIADVGSTPFPPGQPAAPEAIAGHCGGLIVRWPPNPLHDQVSFYRIRYGDDPFVLDGVVSTTSTEHFLGGLADGVDYTLRVEALNEASVVSRPSVAVTRRTSNVNTPRVPQGVGWTVGPSGGIRLAWDPVTANAVQVPDATLRDLAGYRVYRATDPGTAPGPTTRISDEGATRAVEYPDYVDRRAVSCREYVYRVTAVDSCGAESAPTDEVAARVDSTEAPRAPSEVRAFNDGAEVRLKWEFVRDDVQGSPVWVEDFRVYRTDPLPEHALPPGPAGFFQQATVHGASEYRDAAPPAGHRYWYAVKAFDDCGNESALSRTATATCAFRGDVIFVEPSFDARGWPDATVLVRVVSPSGAYERLRLVFVNEDDGTTRIETLPGPGPQWSFVMRGPGLGPYTEGRYRIVAEVDQLDGSTVCTNSASVRIRLTDE